MRQASGGLSISAIAICNDFLQETSDEGMLRSLLREEV